MKLHPLFITLFWAMLLPLHAQTDEEQLPVSTLLERLDEAIAHKEDYQQLRFARADSLLTRHASMA